ncbi:N-acetylmuramoyl-L-alanine amidase [Bacillus sp. Bva_UNVM-123]|uniref:N-acetylmuramoyl-L-alanine amidase n=1 Tax=Bacillus sp. Bva_UNVM-123 TaxID=2829798 RepID=UPI00391F658C
MKKLIASSVLATAALFPTFAQAEGLNPPASMILEQKVEIGKEAVITGSLVNVRKGATTSYDVVVKLSNGKVVKVIDSFKNSIGEIWYRIETGSIRGWVIQDYLKSNATINPPPPITEVKTIQVDKTPVRKGATDSYAIVTYVNKSQKITIIDKFTNAKGEIWYRADLGKIKGWIHEKAFEATTNLPSPPSTTDPSTLPEVNSYVYSYQNGLDVRKGATESYASVSKLSVNQKVRVLDHFTPSNGAPWLRVEVNSSLMGWVPASSVGSTQALGNLLYVNVDVANLRSGPSLNDAVVDQASKGARLTAITSEYDSNGDLWYKALTNTNKIVWISSSVVTDKPTNTETTQYVGTKNAVIYAEASFQSAIIERLTYNSKVTVLDENPNVNGLHWVQIKSASGKTGWTPNYEVTVSQSAYTYVSANKGAVIRKGAGTNYAVTVNLTANESLKVLNTLNGWLNVENSSGKRGWVLESQTTKQAPKQLIAPTFTTVQNDHFLNWEKTSKFSISYTTLSSNRLKLTGGLTDIEIPSGKIQGIQSIETFATGADKSVVITFEPGYSFTLRDYTDKVSIKVVQYGLSGKRIIIDPGHGGKDAGTVGPTGLREKDVNLGTALLLKEELERYGAIVTLTRSTDIFLELYERTDIANASTADAFISIHGDSFSATSNGTTTYYNSTVNFNGPRSKTLGNAIQKSLISSLGTYNRGVKEQEFYVNRMNELPSVLVELAFLSNPKEEALLKTTEFRKKAAVGITKGLEEYFNNF